jgi:hypothetical protein
MIYEFECQKQLFMHTLVQTIMDDGTFTMISSNTTNDRAVAATNSDGFVFRSSDDINGNKFIVTFKNIDLDNTPNNTQISIMVSDDYTPHTDPNTNGVFGTGSGRRAYFLTAQANLTLDAIINVHLDIKPHRIILVTHNARPTVQAPSLLYIGYPELSTNIERHHMQNLIMVGTNFPVAGPLVSRDMLNNRWQTHNLYTLIAPTNPNVAGDYNMSPIFIGTGTEGIYGTLDGVWVMPIANISQLDELEQNGDRFKVFRLRQAVNSTGFINLGATANGADTPYVLVVRVVR